MANLTDQQIFEAAVYELSTTDPVMGGPGGVDNRPHQQLANRTAWLKAWIDQQITNGLVVPSDITTAINTHLAATNPHPTYTTVAEVNALIAASPAPTVVGKVLQVVGKAITTQGVQTLQPLVDTQVGAGVDFIMDIVPKGTNSSFLVEYRWFGEMGTANTGAWDCVFNVQRNGVRVNNAGTINTGLSMATQTYGIYSNNASTPEILHLKTLDKTGSTTGTSIQFKLVAASTYTTAQPMWTNRCFNPSLAADFEHGVSEVIITEIAA
ncbi:MAG: hypothetical protein Q9M21_02355 [Mariprofundaceae bacterium]|nr:hypothetical protein [Mariprofundaceae bacterium]